MKKLGFLVNPVAGIGGKVGLKGSDGAETLAKALELGAVPESGKKALVTMTAIAQAVPDLEIYTCPAEMGADICEEAGCKNYRVVGEIESGHTTPADTKRIAQELRDQDLDMILFAGGDGTARDICDAVGTSIPVLGIPTGTKIHSGVYAVNPRRAGELMSKLATGELTRTKEAEVMDIDEDLFRQGVVQARLYGYLRIPSDEKMVQNMKGGRGIGEEASLDLLSNYMSIMIEEEKDTLWIVGTGSTTAAIMEKLGLPGTLLGVDLVYNGEVIANDCTEQDILAVIDNYDKVKIVVTVIGGQGYIFGRGNQQISASVIKKVGRENIVVAATEPKMLSLFGQHLYVDTGDEEVNDMLCGYIKVYIGYDKTTMFMVDD